MKKLILSTVLMAGMTVASYGQGTVLMSNVGNTDTSSTATTSGMYFIDQDGPGAGTPILMDYNVNNAWDHMSINLYAGTTTSSMSLIASILGTDYATYGYLTSTGPGESVFQDLTGADINTGLTAGAVVWLMQEVWLSDSFTSFADAVADGGAFTGTSTWQNASGGVGTPPFTSPAEAFTTMPATILTYVPEPGSFSLLGLGAAMMFIRRRK